MGPPRLIIFVSSHFRYLPVMRFRGCRTGCCRINFGWAQELCIIMFVWMAKFGTALRRAYRHHVGVDVLINRLVRQTRGKFIVFGLLAGALYRHRRVLRSAPFRLGKRRLHYHVFKFPAETATSTRGPHHAGSEMADPIVYWRFPRVVAGCASASCSVLTASCVPANCRTTITATSVSMASADDRKCCTTGMTNKPARHG